MRILIYCDEDLTVAAGGSRQVVELAAALSTRRHKLRVIAPRPARHGERTCATERGKVIAVPVLRRLHLRPITFLAMSGIILMKELLLWKPAVLLWFDSPGQISPLLCATLTGCPYVLFVNGLPREEIRGGWSRRLVACLLQLLLTIATRHAAAVVSVCPELLAFMRSNWGIRREQCALIQNGVDPDRFRPIEARDARRRLGLETDNPYVVFVGGFFPWHGLETLLAAAPAVLRVLPQTKFLLVGDGQTRPQLEDLSRHLGLTDRVWFTGRVEHDDVPWWISAADLCVVLHHPTRSYPGDSMKLWEYMACGRPIVTTAGPGYGDTVEKLGSGVAVPANAPARLAEEVIKLLSDEKARRRMGASGRAAVIHDHTWEARAIEFEAVVSRHLHAQVEGRADG